MKLPEMPSNHLNVLRRIRRCEGEVAAQVVLEHAMRAYAEEAVRLERERIAIEQMAHDSAAELFHRVLCMGEGCQECVRVAAAIRARSETQANSPPLDSL